VSHTPHHYTLGESGYPDDPHFREPSFFAELARASAAAPVASIPVARAEEVEEAADEEESDDGPDGQLAIDVYQTPTDIIIRAPIAGVAKPEDIEIHIAHDVVTIRGERKPDVKVAQNDYLYQECYWGKFSRSVVLPQEVDAEAAVANFSRNGILSLRLPKLVRERARKISVRFS
jgi:HSP20 family protein